MGKVDEEDYYKPILVKIAFKGNYKYYENRRDQNKNPSVKQYLYMIMPYLCNMINDHKTSKTQYGEWKVQIFMHVNFIPSKDTGETCTIYVWSDNENIMWGNETDNTVKELFESFLASYQKEEQIIRGGSDFMFESVELIDYKLHRINLKRRKSYIESPEWLKSNGATINQKRW